MAGRGHPVVTAAHIDRPSHRSSWLTRPVAPLWLCRTMSNVSADVLWSCVRDQSCHLLKRGASRRSGMGKKGGHFTMEPNNLTGINSFKYSGLANSKTVGIEPAKEGKGIVLTTKSRKDGKIRKPAKMYTKTTLTKTFRKTAKTLKSQTSGNFYRADLEKGMPLPPPPCVLTSRRDWGDARWAKASLAMGQFPGMKNADLLRWLRPCAVCGKVGWLPGSFTGASLGRAWLRLAALRSTAERR